MRDSTASDPHEAGRDEPATPGLNSLSAIYGISIFLAFLNHGASDLLTVALLASTIFGLLIVLLIWKEIPDHAVRTFHVASIILVLTICWIAFQTLPLPSGIFSHPAWREVRDLATHVPLIISIAPADDWASLLRIAAPFGIFFCGLLLFQSDGRATAALSAIALAGGIMALLSIGQFVLAPDSLLFGRKLYYLDSLTGPFVNRNTAATFFGLLLLLQAGMLRRRLDAIDLGRVRTRWQQRRPMPLDMRASILWAALYSVLLLLCLVALVLTKSRAGVASAFVALTFMIVLVATRPSSGFTLSRGHVSKKGRKVFVWTIVGLAIPLAFVALSGRVLWRAEVQGADDGRFCVMPAIWSAARDHFPWGTGLSSFAELFPMYRSASCGIWGVWDKAHNVYLEGLIGLGLAFVIVTFVFLVWLIKTFIAGLRSRRRFRFGAEVGAAALLLIVLHSGFDFSLQISGLAVFFAAMLAPVVTLSLRQRRQHPRSESRRRQSVKIIG